MLNDVMQRNIAPLQSFALRVIRDRVMREIREISFKMNGEPIGATYEVDGTNIIYLLENGKRHSLRVYDPDNSTMVMYAIKNFYTGQFSVTGQFED